MLFLWNAMYLKKTWGVPDFGIASRVRRSFLSDGTWISPWEVFNILWKLMWVKSFQSLASLQSQLKWVLCVRAHTHTKIRSSTHLLNAETLFTSLRSRSHLPSMWCVCSGLAGGEKYTGIPWKPTCLIRGAFWLISWSHKGYCYANNYLRNFWLKMVAWNKLFL